jgi:hypothetical protein
MQSKTTFPITIGPVSINYRVERDSVYLDWYFGNNRYRQAVGKVSLFCHSPKRFAISECKISCLARDWAIVF